MKESLVLWADQLAEAFRGAAPDVVEKRLFDTRSFLVDDRVVAQMELRADALRVRFNLPDAERARLTQRPTADPNSAVPTILVVTDDDVTFARSLIPVAYEFARSREPATTSAAAPAPAAPAAAAPRKSPPSRRRASR